VCQKVAKNVFGLVELSFDDSFKLEARVIKLVDTNIYKYKLFQRHISARKQSSPFRERAINSVDKAHKIGYNGNVSWRIEKLTSGRLSTGTAILFVFPTDYMDFPDCLLTLPSISVFYFSVFLFSTFRLVVPCGRLSWLMRHFPHEFKTIKGKGKGSPYSITERRVPELMPVLGSQPRAYSKRVFRTNCALRIKKCAPRISSGIYFLSTS